MCYFLVIFTQSLHKALALHRHNDVQVVWFLGFFLDETRGEFTVKREGEFVAVHNTEDFHEIARVDGYLTILRHGRRGF